MTKQARPEFDRKILSLFLSSLSKEQLQDLVLKCISREDLEQMVSKIYDNFHVPTNNKIEQYFYIHMKKNEQQN